MCYLNEAPPSLGGKNVNDLQCKAGGAILPLLHVRDPAVSRRESCLRYCYRPLHYPCHSQLQLSGRVNAARRTVIADRKQPRFHPHPAASIKSSPIPADKYQRMKTYGLKTAVLASLILLGAETLRAQPTASPTSFNFTYQVNSTTLPAPGKLTATLPKSTATGYTLTASVSPPSSWLTVTPGGGASPLALTVTVNPTSLSPGSYTGVITLGTNPGTGTTDVPVTLSISNAPSSMAVTQIGRAHV